jgi:thioredoxin reductase (NADPH)
MMAEPSLRSIAFPKLEPSQLASFGHCSLTTLKRFKKGEKFFGVGECDAKFFVVKSGEIEIVDNSGDSPKIITVHGPGEFTGEVAQLTGNPALVDGIARTDCDVYEVSTAALRQLINNHPDLGDIILQAFMARRHLLRESGEFMGLRVIGPRHSQDAFRIRDFLTKNHVPFTWLDLEADPQAMQLLKQFGLSEADTPVVACGHKVLLRNPTTRQLAEHLGFCRPLPPGLYDLVIVGAGPAGLAAAVYGASEGLRTAVVERVAPGGQAGRSMRIENYLGFPIGITGEDLAERATIQANKFGACMPIGRAGSTLTFEQTYAVLHLDGDEKVTAKCLVIATGADYRLLEAENCAKFEGCGIYYAATPLEAQLCRGSDVVVVGGGNSAGQAAVYLSAHVGKLYLVIRGDDLNKDMSSYLVKRIEQTGNIELLRNTVVRRVLGDGFLSEAELVNNKTGEVRRLKTPALFSFIGATPRTEWLPPEIEKDTKGFVTTGQSVGKSPQWTAERAPYLLETSRPGVFAIGDVRSGSVKRVASAVGEGAMAVQFVHQYLRTS